MIISVDDKADMDALLDIIIPPDAAKGLPGGSQTGFQPDTSHWESLKILNNSSIARFEKRFHDLSYDERLIVANIALKTHRTFFIQIAKKLAEHYYQHDDVSRAIGLWKTPPFPEGYNVEEGDLSLLESVYLRGSIYRNV